MREKSGLLRLKNCSDYGVLKFFSPHAHFGLKCFQKQTLSLRQDHNCHAARSISNSECRRKLSREMGDLHTFSAISFRSPAPPASCTAEPHRLELSCPGRLADGHDVGTN